MTRTGSLKGIAQIFVAALVFSGCAATTAEDEWPQTVVKIEDVRPVKPMRLDFNYKIREGVPYGTTLLRIHVDKKGATRKVGLVQSSGKQNLDEAVINSAWGATYRPYLINGEPTEVTIVAPFHLR